MNLSTGPHDKFLKEYNKADSLGLLGTKLGIHRGFLMTVKHFIKKETSQLTIEQTTKKVHRLPQKIYQLPS